MKLIRGPVGQDLSTLNTKVSDITKQKPLAGDLIEKLGSPVIQVISDSTGNEHFEWVYLLAQKLASAYSAFNVKYKLYDQPNGQYLAWEDVQHVGEDKYYQTTSASGVSYIIPDADVALTTPAGDVDIRMHRTLDDWQDSSSPFLFTKCGAGAGHYCFALRLISSKIYMCWTVDGTTWIQKATGIDTSSWTDGQDYWIRATLDVDNGASGNTVAGYTSTDGVTWTLAGTTTVTAGVTSVFVDATADYVVGSRDSGAGKALGKVYEINVRDGIGGAEVFPQPIDALRAPSDVNFNGTFGGTPTIYIYNASVSGSGISNWNNSTYVKNAIPITQGANLFVSLGHNDGNSRNLDYINKYDAFIALVNARAVASNKYLLTQNPINNQTYRTLDRSVRRRMLMGWAKGKGMLPIDTYQDFINDPRGWATLLSDGLHPNTDGQLLILGRVWSDLAL